MPKRVYMYEKWEPIVDPIKGQGLVFRGNTQIAKVQYNIRYERQVKLLPHQKKTITVDVDLTRIEGELKIIDGTVETNGQVVKVDDVLTLHLSEGCKLDFTYIPIGNRQYKMVVHGDFY